MTSNLNGIRSAVRKGLLTWLAGHLPHVWCAEEVRAPQEAIDPIVGRIAALYQKADRIASPQGLHAFNQVCRIPGRAGVAQLTTLPVEGRRAGLDGLSSDVDSGRWVEQDLKVGGRLLTVATCYVHSGDIRDPVKMAQKSRFLSHMDARLEQMAGQAAGDPRHDFLVCGDLNVCHTPLDIKNARGNRRNTGFLPAERAHMDHWTEDLGFHDVVRDLAGPIAGPYTWWSRWGHSFDTNTGWRIDYEFATPRLAARARGWRVFKAPDYGSAWSDHAALAVSYDL